jgi:cellulose synthase/poly-beta-1,6-N-acetylglucosamine synthase-like glycosyltransferase
MWQDFLWSFLALLQSSGESSWLDVALKFFPFVLLLELPLYVLVMLGMVRYGLREARPLHQRMNYPSVSCIITCYSEGEDVSQTINSLALQEYAGTIQILPVVDGSVQNKSTLEAAMRAAAAVAGLPNREVMVLPKGQRGGRVSALNTGLQFATGAVVMALDGDTSFDNDMVARASSHFDDPNVVGVAGCLRARNARASLAARLQGLEYVLSIGAGKTGLSEFNLVNNISGAFGVFRASFIRNLGGWDTGTAEDLNMTLRIKQYFGRYPGLRIVFDPHAVGHTDVPASFKGFFGQRLRWDGDLFYIYVRKFRHSFSPSLLGWRTFLFTMLTGLLLQMVMPFVIVVYTLALFFKLPPGSILGILAFVYCLYLLALTFYLGLYVLAVSERPKQDLLYFLYLPLFPVFAFVSRVHSAFAILNEIVTKSHLDSAMAPWWVLRNTER